MSAFLRLALVLAVGVALAACGGSGGTGERTVIDEADQQRAEGALLRLSDFPAGWAAEPAAEGEGEGGGAGGEPDCLEELDPDLSGHTVTGNAESEDFTREGSFISSFATVYEDEAQARSSFDRNVDALASDAARACLAGVFEAAVEAESDAEADIGKITGDAPALPALAEQARGVGFEIPFEVQGQTATAFVEFIALRQERAIAVLVGVSFLAPFPDEETERLARLVASRLTP